MTRSPCRPRAGSLTAHSFAGEECAEHERGSGPAEFVLVGALLTVLTLAVLQLGLAVYVRNVVHDAAVEGAHQAALADATPAHGVERTREIIVRAVGAAYADDISASHESIGGMASITVAVRTTLPVVGLLGIPSALEVEASAPVETLR
ncbi:TadE/TadG family type IV pilus assembly protein [Microbacterium marinilacus]|uniref:TadE-like domain-containing protein n=1 Tax=Microbacterium marinilacus TaxID=415209 RepID=A0ABP7B5M0_9MICO|nr:TadE/TadG family type IV pilus assembly protein [Microbacterium marinilacus]MBY0687864.1 pilus assembly protein [Microbacterium marinilacus]